MTQKTKEIKRCAIYTRKSNEDGLDQEYNSLDAQRDAGENYIRSQAHDGWVLMPDRYDDGGISGSTVERPALQRLLEDIKSGKIDIVVVYKIDRLSRSMFDFLGMIRLFDERNVSFVSVTQNINTDSAMGRLMLNVLQSFAQFEMEQTGERIRDKIAASKAKGMWTGGKVPLGYDLDEGKLVINTHDAETIHYIFRRYLQIGSMSSLRDDLKKKGFQTKEWVSQKGKYYPPKDFAKSSLYRILNNRTYIGKIQHKAADKIYEGQHEAIIEDALWDKVQNLLKKNTADKIRIPSNKDRPYLLKGILENPNGYRMTPSAQRKNGKLYRYYVSMESIKKGAKTCPVKTISAQLIEEVVLDRIKQMIGSTERIGRILKLEESDLRLPDVRAVINNFSVMWSELFPAEQARIVRLMIDKIVLHPNKVLMHFWPLGLISVLQELKPDLDLQQTDPQTDDPVTLEIPISFKKKGARKYIKTPNGQDIVTLRQPKYDHALIKAVVRAHDWQSRLATKQARTTKEIAEQENLRETYVQKIIKLVDLSPDITTAILNGQQPHSLTLSQIRDIPLSWQEQREQFGFHA